MPNGHYYYSNPGAVLRRLFPKQLGTQALILIWTVIFILDIIIVACVHNFVFYPITDFSRESLQEHVYFKESKILLVEEHEDYYITYENVDGEKRVAHLEMFPRRIFERARIDKDYDCAAKEDGSIDYVDTNMRDALWTGNAIQKLAVMYCVIGAVILLFEFFLYRVFHRLFRE